MFSGVIHGDLHDQNMLFNEIHDPQKSGYVMNTITDLAHMSRSYLVFDLAIVLSQIMRLDRGEHFLKTGEQVLHGFREEVELNDYELHLLKYIVMMRHAALLVMENHSLSVEPRNAAYVTRHSATVWRQLVAMWRTSELDLDRAWGIAIRQHLTLQQLRR